MEELPGDLEGDRSFACTGRKGQQDAGAAARDRAEDALDGSRLVVVHVPGAGAVFVGHFRKAVPPGIRGREGQSPELVRRWIAVCRNLLAGRHRDAVETMAVGRVGEGGSHLRGVRLGLSNALSFGKLLALGFDDGELLVVVDKDVVGDLSIRTAASTKQAAFGDVELAQHPRTRHDTPACCTEGRVNELGASFRLVPHGG